MFLKRPLTSATLATALALAAMAPLPAAAQTAAPGAEMIEQQDKLDAFIAAAIAVAEVRDRYLDDLQQAQTDEAQGEIIEQANTAILNAVEEAPGITVDEYIAIGEAAAADPELNARLNDRVAELQSTQD